MQDQFLIRNTLIPGNILSLEMIIIKGYCTRSRINCGMAKTEVLLASDLAIPQLTLE